MPFSRFIFFASKHRSREALSLLRSSGLPKRGQACSYSKSSRFNNGKPDGHPVLPVETEVSRSWGSFVIPAAALLGFAGLAAVVHYNDERRSVPKGQGKGSDGNIANGPIIGGPFTLIDTNNQTITEKNLLGNWILLYFGYTSSPDIGPEQVQMMAKTIDILESKQNVKIQPVFVTIDPQRDTPSQLRAYLKEFDPRILGLTGPVTAIRRMAQEYRVYFKKVEEEGGDYLVDSSHKMYLLNPNMEVVRCFGVEYNAEELSEEILYVLKRTSS
ncbi:Protein SCO1, mitochondrial-like protein [Quillaja saponaria]|uniref:Protein SCO1, mitochondrial-like protein n=1 Tax=Quillaja saponaria TaxID=32244 RepID=A0AAD7LET8_QUISA|nr:Protein SCO1, mitochondrial-like protein [Quillaja saponaria]